MKRFLLTILLAILPAVAHAQIRPIPTLDRAYRAGGTITGNATDLIFNMGSGASTFDFEVQSDGTITFSVSEIGGTLFQTFTDSTTGFQILDKDGGVPVFNVDTTNERVGIGTATPSDDFEVVYNISGDVKWHFKTFETVGVRFQRTGSTGGWIHEYGFLANDGTDLAGFGALGTNTGLTHYYIGDYGSERIIVLNNGNVGVSDTTPDAVLEVSASGSLTPFMVSSDDDTDGDWLTVSNVGLVTAGLGVTVTTGDVIASQGAVATTPDATTLGNGVTTLAVDTCVVTLTGDGGANVVGTITGGVSGQLLTVIFVDGFVTITDTDAHTANTVDLEGTATDLISADDTVLQIVFDGTSWYEVSRSVN